MPDFQAYENTDTAVTEAFRHGLSIEDMLADRYGPTFALPDGDDYELNGVITISFDA